MVASSGPGRLKDESDSRSDTPGALRAASEDAHLLGIAVGDDHCVRLEMAVRATRVPSFSAAMVCCLRGGCCHVSADVVAMGYSKIQWTPIEGVHAPQHAADGRSGKFCRAPHLQSLTLASLFFLFSSVTVMSSRIKARLLLMHFI